MRVQIPAKIYVDTRNAINSRFHISLCIQDVYALLSRRDKAPNDQIRKNKAFIEILKALAGSPRGLKWKFFNLKKKNQLSSLAQKLKK